MNPLTTLNDIPEVAAGRFRLSREESWDHEFSHVREPDRAWYELIPCRGADTHIKLYSMKPVELMLSSCRKVNCQTIWEAIKGTPGVRADFYFDGEAVLYFPPSVLHIVAKLAEARYRRQGKPLTAAQKAAFDAGRIKSLGQPRKGGKFHAASPKKGG